LASRGVYGESKAAAEAGLKEIAENTGMQVTVVRPPLIYGPGAPGNFHLLVQTVECGIPLPFASIRNRRAFVSVQNLASGALGSYVGAAAAPVAEDERPSGSARQPDWIHGGRRLQHARNRLAATA
jgi:nucleoside-diphosphate-sugar epimerase